jgi:D-alanyl-D-alanine carboxypeptidase/D-alanyl-D-alanine-endopeptidase (penicillin-binding protein 4)
MHYTPVSQTSNRRRAGNPSRVVLVLGVLGAVLLGGLCLLTSSVAARTVPDTTVSVFEQPRVPVLSVRRFPDVLSVGVRTSRLKDRLSRVEELMPSGSCLTVAWLGRRLASVNSDISVTPGSVIKLVTAAGAMKALGADTTYTTSLNGLVENGVVAGNVYLVGAGDPLLVRRDYVLAEKYPTLTPTFLETLADAVVATGVKVINGSIVPVDDRYDDQRFLPSWPSDFYGVEAGPLGALMVADGAQLGQFLKPDDPGLAAATDLRTLLSLRGVTVVGTSMREPMPAGLPSIATITSVDMGQVVREMLVNSDNNTAELLVKEMGVAKKGAGTSAAGLEVVKDSVAELGVDTSALTQLDGSGLASGNKVTCQFVSSLLATNRDVFVNRLSIAGEVGTLREYYTSSQARGRLVAKTGTLSGVKALAGYMTVEGGEPVELVLIMNSDGIDQSAKFRPVWNALVDATVRASVNPTVETLLP